MEQTNIKDMVTLRAVAMEMATQTVVGIVKEVKKYCINDHFDIAKEIASYIKGNAKLPEFDDPNEQTKKWTDMFRKVHQDLNHFSKWISDSKIKPAYNVEVLVMCKGYDSPLFGKYIEDGYWEVLVKDFIKRSTDGEIEVLAWMPIPKYEQTKQNNDDYHT